MSKIFTFVFTFIMLSYVFFLYHFRISEENLFNQRYRPYFLRSAIAREIFFLDRIGDARFEYFNTGKQVVLVEIDYQAGKEPNIDIEQWISGLIFHTLRKDVEIRISQEKKIPDRDGFSDKELIKLAKNTRNLGPDKDRSYLHLVYVSKSIEALTNTGLVLTAGDIFIFVDRIRELSNKDSIRSRIEQSTIKHEFGHLLGLEHVDSENCIMSERVEVYEKKRFQFENIPTDYCEETLDNLRRLREEAF